MWVLMEALHQAAADKLARREIIDSLGQLLLVFR